MKNVILLALAVCSVMLFSFTNSDGTTEKDRVFRIDADGGFNILQPEVVSAEDMQILAENITGWTECSEEHTANTCKTQYKEFPPIGQKADKVLAIVEKYNSM